VEGKKLAKYKQKWLNRVSRMEDIRYPKQLLKYRPDGKIYYGPLGRIGRGGPLNGLLDG
jgi:hypothetical protein